MNLFKNKKVFFVSYSEVFFEDILEQFLKTSLVKLEDLVVVNYKISCEKVQVYYPNSLLLIDIEIVDIQYLCEADMIFFLSLHKWNSVYAEEILYKFKYPVESFYIILFDDEVDRWMKSFDQYSFLSADDKLLIAQNDINVLSIVNNFIGLMSMERNISKMLKRNIHMFEILYPFWLIEEKHYPLIEEFMETRKMKRKVDEFSILYGTKPQSIENTKVFLKEIIFFLLKRKNFRKQLTLFLWINPIEFKNYFIWHLMMLIKIIAKSKGLQLNIKFIYRQPKLSYFIQLLSIDTIIMQERGGFSSLFQYLEFGGKVLVDKVCTNRTFLDSYNLTYVPFETTEKLCEIILTKDKYDVNKIDDNCDKIEKIREDRQNSLRNFLNHKGTI
ncbi:MAG: hypothetical protein RBT59_00105 [Arcobacteraceae bacterium]|jgi:hypothetical protein|nr:hypothetical protein [Arcobacteraceae bacterium]